MNGSSEARRVLISGAGFAGLTSAIWMHRLGYQVTVVETSANLKKGGTPVDIRDETVDIVARLGLLDDIRAKALPERVTEFTNVHGVMEARLEPGSDDDEGESYEIHRDDLLAILRAAVPDDVEFRFTDSISTLTDAAEKVTVGFRDGSELDFDLVLGCDGNHSIVRRLRFGPESNFSRFLHNYFTVAIVDGLVITPQTTRILNTPGRTLMLNSYDNTTDVVLVFHSDDEIPYDYHDVDEQKRLLRERMSSAGPVFAEFVDKMESADNFYFDKLSQIRMPRWTSGRVALVGDAGYCASPAAGMGGSLAIIGATALSDAIAGAGGDIAAAFAGYERALRPVVERIQTQAEEFGAPTFFPSTQEAINLRNSHLRAG